jgi:transposase
MYIRKVLKSNRNPEKSYPEFRFIRTYRTPQGPRQKALLTLRELDLPEEQWKTLADAVEDLLAGQPLLFHDARLQTLAEHCARLIGARQDPAENIVRSDPDSVEYVAVDLNSVHTHQVRTLGAEAVGLAAWRELGLDDLFRSLGFDAKQRNHAALSVIGRLAAPDSENATVRWARERTALGELLGADFTKLSHNALYRIADAIYEHRDEIEEHLRQRECDLFRLEERILLYDLTNTYLEGIAADNPKARFGRSKEKRPDCRLLTLGLVLDEAGFPKRSRVMAGNINEPATLAEMVENLRQPGSEAPTVVIDAGIATEKNLAYLRSAGYHYLCVHRNPSRRLLKPVSGVFETVRETDDNLVRVQVIGTGTETTILCQSTKRAQKERSMRELQCQRFEAELERLRASLAGKYATKRPDKLLIRIGRLRERYAAVSRFYAIESVVEGERVVDLCWRLEEPESLETLYSDAYCLRTSRTDLDEKTLWSLYMTLTDIERAFRCLKTDLAFRPVYHQKERRADSHLFIAVLAYHLLNLIRLKLDGKGIRHSWSRLRKELSTHVVVTTTLRGENGKLYQLRDSSVAEPQQLAIYQAMGLSPRPFCREKRIIDHP